jgi:hypothetical protein
VAVISGSRGVLVVGGATGDDVVEFLDWEIKNVWRVLGRETPPLIGQHGSNSVCYWLIFHTFCNRLFEEFCSSHVIILLFSLKSYFDDLAPCHIYFLYFDYTFWQGGSFAF